MDTYTAVGIAEGFVEAGSEEQVIEAWQYLIDTGLAWQLQGWFGRTAAHLIGEGICTDNTRAAQAAIQSAYH
jgi:hypothetical protein